MQANTTDVLKKRHGLQEKRAVGLRWGSGLAQKDSDADRNNGADQGRDNTGIGYERHRHWSARGIVPK